MGRRGSGSDFCSEECRKENERAQCQDAYPILVYASKTVHAESLLESLKRFGITPYLPYLVNYYWDFRKREWIKFQGQ